MSQIDIRSPKHCAKKGFKCNFNKKLLKIISTLTFSLVSIILLLYFTLHPSKPQFILQQLDIDQLDFSSPHLLNSTIEITLEVRNPNQRVGVYYDELQAYASYKGQQITLDTIIVPSFYQGQQDSNLLSASLNGMSMPVSASLRYQVGQDQANGKMIMVIKVNGQVRWKVASWVSGRYMIQVNCVAILALGLPNLEGPLNSKQGTQCSLKLAQIQRNPLVKMLFLTRNSIYGGSSITVISLNSTKIQHLDNPFNKKHEHQKALLNLPLNTITDPNSSITTESTYSPHFHLLR